MTRDDASNDISYRELIITLQINCHVNRVTNLYRLQVRRQGLHTVFPVAAEVAQCHRGALRTPQQVLHIQVSRLGLLQRVEFHLDPIS